MPSIKLPSNIVAPEFGEVRVERDADKCRVSFTILTGPTGVAAEGWRTGVALDASYSMMKSYGRMLVGKMPSDAMERYRQNGWTQKKTADQISVADWDARAVDDALKNGWVKYSENVVEPFVRKMATYLAGNIDSEGKTEIIYWACDNPQEKESVPPGYRGYSLGVHNTAGVEKLAINGPKQLNFGYGTCLAPALKYFTDAYRDATNSMFVFITDGRLDDLDEVKALSCKICQEIAAKSRNLTKCVLIGIGSNIDEDQMIQLDDLDPGVDVDLWDHRIADTMRDAAEIFAELVDEQMLIPLSAVVYDHLGNVVRKFTDSFPQRIKFEIDSPNADKFVFEANGAKIEQKLPL